MVRAFSKDLARREILVNAIAPGPTATELFLKGKPQQLIDTIASSNPHKRLGKPEEIADAIALLAGPDSRWISGQTILVNGGAV
jgi:3-oxoacyl-[acyl-carrier protein] reductase